MFEIIDRQGRKFLGTTSDIYETIPMKKYTRFKIARVNILRRFPQIEIEGFGALAPRLTFLQLLRDEYELNVKDTGSRYFDKDTEKHPDKNILEVYKEFERFYATEEA